MSRPQRPQRPQEYTEEDGAALREGLGAAASFLGPTQPMPDDFKSNISWAEDVMKKMFPGKA